MEFDAPIFLLGMPRSGTTWLSQIFESSPEVAVRLSPPYSFDFRGKLTETSTQADWERILSSTFASQDKFLTQNWRRDTGELPEFHKNSEEAHRLAIKDTRFHALYQAAMSVLPKSKIIYIVRHPAASLWSWRSCKEFPEGADFREEWREGNCRKLDRYGEYWGFSDWLGLTKGYRELAEKNPDRVFVLSYEHMVDDCVGEVGRVFEFSGLQLYDETVDFIELSQQTDDPRPYSVFKKPTRADPWRNHFPSDILATIQQETLQAGLEEYLG